MAPSIATGIAQMIVQYDWILEDVDEEPRTYASKMILFRGQRVFRVGLKNHVQSAVLFFVAIDLSKMGMAVRRVLHGIQDSGNGPGTMTQMTKEGFIGNDDGSLQLFTIKLAKQVSGTCTFVFRIHIDGSALGYSYQLADRLAKTQLWAAVSEKNKYLVDVEIVVKGKTFSAHKAILAARSPVFAAAIFTQEQQGNDQPLQIQIDGVEPSTVEKFLHFIYAGESMGTLANEELLKLADEYQLITLTRLCRTALKGIETSQMAHVTNILHMNDAEIPCSYTIR
jgi:speckle-type POZ protein